MNKKDLIKDDPQVEGSYPTFMVNRGLSQFPDTIFYANEMNLNSILDNKLQYDYLLYSVRKRKRVGKWAKASEDDDIELITQIYKYNRQRAIEALRILSKKDIKGLRAEIDKGGLIRS